MVITKLNIKIIPVKISDEERKHRRLKILEALIREKTGIWLDKRGRAQ